MVLRLFQMVCEMEWLHIQKCASSVLMYYTAIYIAWIHQKLQTSATIHSE
jgi:hypothetical protein